MKKKDKKINKIKQPDYLLFIISVSLVLFIFGIIGWLVLGVQRAERVFKEKVKMHVYLMDGVNYDAEKKSLIMQLRQFKEVKDVIFRDKNYALKEWKKLGGEDFMEVTKENILPESLEVYFKGNLVTEKELHTIGELVEKSFIVSNVAYPFELFSQFKLFKRVTFYLTLLGIALFIVSVVILNYLVKLIIYNNRFVIRAMTLVGATNKFISLPFERRAVLNGFLSAFLALLGVYFSIRYVVQHNPDLEEIYRFSHLVFIGVMIFVLGVFISWVSTFFTVRKYLNAAALERFY